MLTQAEREKLEREADQLLRKAGFKANGQPKDQKTSWDFTGESVRAVATPMGGQNRYSRKLKRR